MNQRILKKLAKKAVPVFQALNKAKLCNITISEPDHDGVPIGSSFKFDRKHFERNRALHERYEFDRGNTIAIKVKNPNSKYPFIRLHSPFESWPNVPFFEWRCCWDVPEYDAEDLWSALVKQVESHFHQPIYHEDGDMDWGYIPNTSNPRRVFKLAQRMLSEVAA